MMSDWVATYDGVGAANGGLDLEMPPASTRMSNSASGDSGRSRQGSNHRWRGPPHFDTAARFGWLTASKPTPRSRSMTRKFILSLSEGVREGNVLLKNEGSLLPLMGLSCSKTLIRRASAKSKMLANSFLWLFAVLFDLHLPS